MFSLTFLTPLGILLAVVADIVIGGLWYSPLLFGNLWMKLNNIDPTQMKASEGIKAIATGTVVDAIATVSLALLLSLSAVGAMQEALMVGFFAWGALIFPICAHGFIYEKRPMQLVVLHAAHLLVWVLTASAILFFFAAV